MSNITPPCIGVCSTTYGDDYCRGCKRHVDEITDWVTYSDAEKLALIQQLDQQLSQASTDFVAVDNQQLLAEQIKKHNLRCDFNRAPVYWLLCLLREGKDKIKDISQYGIKLKMDLTPDGLFSKLDDAFYQLASAN